MGRVMTEIVSDGTWVIEWPDGETELANYDNGTLWFMGTDQTIQVSVLPDELRPKFLRVIEF